MAPPNLTTELLPLALPLTDHASLYTPAQQERVLDELGLFVAKHLSEAECRHFNGVLEVCVEGLTQGTDADGQGWERLKNCVAKMDNARRREERQVLEIEREVAVRVAREKDVAARVAREVEGGSCLGGEALDAPSSALIIGDSKDAATQTPRSPNITPSPITAAPTIAKKEPFLRTFLAVIAPLCDDPAQYTDEQRGTFFKALADFFSTNLTLDEQARFSVTLDECCELSLTDAVASNAMMRKMIHQVARERVEKNVRDARIREVEEAMRAKQNGKVKEKVDGKGEGSIHVAVVAKSASANASSQVKGTPTCSAPANDNEINSASSPQPIAASSELAVPDDATMRTEATADGTTTPRKAFASTLPSPTSTDAPTSPWRPLMSTSLAQTTPFPNPARAKIPLRLPKLLSRDLDILLSIPDPRRTSLYLRMVLEPVTNTQVILTAELHRKYSRTFASVLTQRMYDEDVRGETGEWKWGGVLGEDNFVGVLCRAIPGVQVVFNERDGRVWARGLKERKVALTFAGTGRKRERKMLEYYWATGQVDAVPKSEFARKLAADPLFARQPGGSSGISGTLPRRFYRNQKTYTVSGERDGEDAGFPGVGIKPRTDERTLDDYYVQLSDDERTWPSAEVMTEEGREAAVDLMGKKRGMGRTEWRFGEMEKKGVLKAVKEGLGVGEKGELVDGESGQGDLLSVHQAGEQAVGE